MSKLLCAIPDVDIYMTVFISIDKWQYVANYLMNNDDYNKSVLFQVVDWCRQAVSNYLSQRRQNLAIWRHQATL